MGLFDGNFEVSRTGDWNQNAQRVITKDPLGESMQSVGKGLIDQDMQAKREATLEKYKANREQRGYDREDARNKVEEARYKSEMELKERDRKVTAKYRADTLEQDKKQNLLSRADAARSAALDAENKTRERADKLAQQKAENAIEILKALNEKSATEGLTRVEKQQQKQAMAVLGMGAKKMEVSQRDIDAYNKALKGGENKTALDREWQNRFGSAPPTISPAQGGQVKEPHKEGLLKPPIEKEQPTANYSDRLSNLKNSKNPQKTSDARKENIRAEAMTIISQPIPEIVSGKKGSGRYANRDMTKIKSTKALNDSIKKVQLAIDAGNLTPEEKQQAEQYILSAQQKL